MDNSKNKNMNINIGCRDLENPAPKSKRFLKILLFP